MNAAAYCRYSSDNQREESIDAQIRAINDYSLRNNINIVRIYTDEAKSATTDQRPGFLNMIKDSKDGLFDMIIVHKLDRFARDRYDSAIYKRQLRHSGVLLRSVLENLDNSPESVILESVLEGMAEYYSKNLSREVMKGMIETALKAQFTGGTPPLGYNVGTDKKLVINENEACSIRIIFEMYLDGHGYSAIMERLNHLGYTTKKGKPFGKNSLHEILKNEKYAGVYIYNKVKYVGHDGKRSSRRSKDDADIIRIEDGVPAIITGEEFEKVRSKMKDNVKKNGANTAKTVYLLSSKVRCGKCGAMMVGKTIRRSKDSADTYHYYECDVKKRTRQCDAKGIRKELLEEKIVDTLYDHMFAPTIIDSVVERIYAYITDTSDGAQNEVVRLESELSKTMKQLNNLIDMVAENGYNPSVKPKMDDLSNTRDLLQARLVEAKHEATKRSFSKEQIKGYLIKYQDIKNMTSIQQKKALQIFVEHATVSEDRIDLSILTGFSKTTNPPDLTQGDVCGPLMVRVERNRSKDHISTDVLRFQYAILLKK